MYYPLKLSPLKNPLYRTVFLIHGVKRYLNTELLIERDISPEKVKEMKKIHRRKETLFVKMRVSSGKELRRLAALVTECDFLLQDAWGFQRDESKHRWWDVPNCLCPKDDNRDSPLRIIHGECPIHSGTLMVEDIVDILGKLNSTLSQEHSPP